MQPLPPAPAARPLKGESQLGADVNGKRTLTKVRTSPIAEPETDPVSATLNYRDTEQISPSCVLASATMLKRKNDMTDYDKKPEVRVTQAGDSSTGIAVIIAALILVIGAFVLFNGGFDTGDNPKVVQNNNTLPAPVIEVPATPDAAAPPVTQKANPPADAPAANP